MRKTLLLNACRTSIITLEIYIVFTFLLFRYAYVAKNI